MHRKFIENGFQWGNISKKKKGITGSRYLKKPHLILRKKSRVEDNDNDDSSEEVIEENKYEENDGYYDHFNFNCISEYHPSKNLTTHNIAVNAIRKGNGNDLKQVLSSRNFKRCFQKKCHLCMTSDNEIQKYLIFVENASPCYYGYHCGGYQQYKEIMIQSESAFTSQLNFKQHQEIKKMYRGECPLCITTDTKIHQYMIDEFAIKPCRKYDCLGYDQYIFTEEFPEILSLLFSISRYNHKKLLIDKNPVIGEILYLTTQMLDDTFRELLSYIHLTPLQTKV